MDIHEQLNKNLNDTVKWFESRMGQYDKALEQTAAKVVPCAESPDLQKLAEDFNLFKDTVWKSLSLLKKQVELLTLGLDRSETHSRRKVLLLHGIPEGSMDDVDRKLMDVIKNNLQLPDFDRGNIDICHRLGVKKATARPVLVRFTTLNSRNTIWTSKTKLKGSGITITEFLTRPRQEVFAAARGRFGIKNCWSADGSILVSLPDKTRIKIVSMSELNKLIEKYPLDNTQDTRTMRTRRPIHRK